VGRQDDYASRHLTSRVREQPSGFVRLGP
jgi:hypothetical protein